MIFGRVMALGLWPNIYLSPLFFAMLGDIDLRVYDHKLQINFEIRSG
jgi:hypothetical protein